MWRRKHSVEISWIHSHNYFQQKFREINFFVCLVKSNSFILCFDFTKYFSSVSEFLFFPHCARPTFKGPRWKRPTPSPSFPFLLMVSHKKREKTRISALMHKGHGGSQSPLYQGLIILLQKKCWTVHEFLQQIVAHFYPLPNLVDSVLPTIHFIIVSLGL